MFLVSRLHNYLFPNKIICTYVHVHAYVYVLVLHVNYNNNIGVKPIKNIIVIGFTINVHKTSKQV